MKILNEEHFENVKRYAESIGEDVYKRQGFPRRSAESCGCRTAEDDGDYEGVD